MRKQHKISIPALRQAFDTEKPERKMHGWHACHSTFDGDIIPNMGGGSTATDHGFKLHISIHPSQMKEGAILIAQTINQSDFPNEIGIKFSSSGLANTDSRQFAKQVAFAPVGSGAAGELTKEDIRQFKQLLENIDRVLNNHHIKSDPVPLNSDNRVDKQNRAIPLANNEISRFSYRDEHFLPMDDEIYRDIMPRRHHHKPHAPQTDGAKTHYVKMSHMKALAQSQRYNPLMKRDPFLVCKLFSEHLDSQVKHTWQQLKAALEDTSLQQNVPGYIQLLKDLGQPEDKLQDAVVATLYDNYPGDDYKDKVAFVIAGLTASGYSGSEIEAYKADERELLEEMYVFSGGSRGRANEIFGTPSSRRTLEEAVATLDQRASQKTSKPTASAFTLFAVAPSARNPIPPQGTAAAHKKNGGDSRDDSKSPPPITPTS